MITDRAGLDEVDAVGAGGSCYHPWPDARSCRPPRRACATRLDESPARSGRML